MPRPAQVDMIQLFSFIENNYGTEAGTTAIRAGAEHMGYSYATICNRMEPYKTGRGKWNLTIEETREQLEEMVAPERDNLVPRKILVLSVW